MSQTNQEANRGESSGPPPFLANLKQEDLSVLNARLKGLVLSLRSLDPGVSGSTLKKLVAEMFPPGVLFDEDIREFPNIYLELRNFLEQRAVILPQHSSRRTMMTLSHNLYEEAEDRAAAIEITNLIIAHSRRGRSATARNEPQESESASQDARSNNYHNSPEKTAHNVAMRLKDQDKKFTGELGECWSEFVDHYVQVCNDYSLTQNQRLLLMHNILSKDAQRFYLDRVRDYASTFEQAVNMIEMEYNSPVRQTRVKNYLSNLRVSKLVNDGAEVSIALAKVYRQIINLSRQVPASHHGEAHRIEFLRRAVVGYDWSREPLSRVATHSLTFQQLYGELEAAVQLDKESKLANLQDRASSVGDQGVESDGGIASINYAGQGRYSIPTKGRRTSYGQGRQIGYDNGSKNKIDPLSLVGCFNCGEKSHFARDCTRPKNFAAAAARKIEYLQNKKAPNTIHVVLADLCRQLDTNEREENASEEDTDDAKIFRAIAFDDDVQDIHNVRQEGDHDEDKKDEDTITIFSCNVPEFIRSSACFNGACVDSGAQRTVIGRNQAIKYMEESEVGVNMLKGVHNRRYKFGDKVHHGLGTLKLEIPVKEDFVVRISADVVNVDVPLLIGLDTLTKLKAILDLDQDTLSSKVGSWKLPLRRKLGHVYLEWPISIFYTELELRRAHKHFYHPSTEKLLNVLHRADPGAIHSRVRSTLNKIRDTCDVCQRLAPQPHRFRVSLPHETCVFNRIVSLDLMTIDRDAVLHAVDRDTRFSAAAHLTKQTAAHIWETFLKIWVAPYVGFPDKVALDQGTQLQSLEFRSLLNAAGIGLSASGVEGHNSLGNGERYHKYLREVYRRVKEETPLADKTMMLRLAVKAVNDTAGPSGLVPTLLVFGVLPRMPLHPKELPNQRERMRLMTVARNEMNKLTAQTRVDQAIKRNSPAATREVINILDQVLVYREAPVDQWVGPYVVQSVDGKQVILDVNGRNVPFGIDKVKHYHSPENHLQTTAPHAPIPSNHIENSEEMKNQKHHTVHPTSTPITNACGAVSHTIPVESDQQEEKGKTRKKIQTDGTPSHSIVVNDDVASPIDPKGQHASVPSHDHLQNNPESQEVVENNNTVSPASENKEGTTEEEEGSKGLLSITQDHNVQYHPDILDDLWNPDDNSMPTEVFEQWTVKEISPNDPRGDEPDFQRAKKREVDGLIKRNTWSKVQLKDLQKDANIMGGRFVLTLKNYQTPNESAKVRYVAQGYNDRDRPFLVHDATSIRVSSIRILQSAAKVLGFRIFSHDVTQAYLQSRSNLSRKIYIRPKSKDLKTFGLREGELLELNRPLYGLCDAGDYWGNTMEQHLINDLGMKPTVGDPSLYVKKLDGKTIGVSGSYVDDQLNAGTKDFIKMTDSTLRTFESKPRLFDRFDFYGMQFETVSPQLSRINQEHYAKNLALTPIGCTFEQFRRDRALFTWITHTRPDVACIANRASQVTEKTFCKEKVKELNKGVMMVKCSPSVGLQYGELTGDLHLKVFADASYGNNDDLSSQLGYIILLSDDMGNCHVIDYRSRKSRRVVRSVMGAEVYALLDAFDAAFTIACDMNNILNRDLPIVVYTDSRQVFDAITRGRRTTEKRLSIELSAARESYKKREINRVALIRGSENPADAFTKTKPNDVLQHVLQYGKVTVEPVLWITREGSGNPSYSEKMWE